MSHDGEVVAVGDSNAMCPNLSLERLVFERDEHVPPGGPHLRAVLTQRL